MTRSGNLIFVTDKAFKFEKLRPAGSKLLSEDQNFRLAHDRFSTESIFIYVNVALEDKTKPKPPTAEEIAAEEEQARIKAEAEAAKNPKPTEVTPSESATSSPEPDSDDSPDDPPTTTATVDPVLVAVPSEPTPTPNPSQQLQMAAYSSFGTIFGLLGSGEPEWPDAVGLAISQESDDYVIRAILLGPENGKRLPLPFVPQLLAGRAYTPNAPSVLPDDTEIFVSASLDLPKTYEGLLKQAEKRNADEEVAMRKMPAAQRRHLRR